jgi:DNA-directed RNA polymerase subunit D
MYDEILAHRLGLIPLKTNLAGEDLLLEKSKSQVKFVLHKKGPGMVYSGDLTTKDKEVRPVRDNIPLVKLGEDQEIFLEAIAKLGRGKEHAKWQPVNVCWYRHIPKMQIPKGCGGCGACAKACPNQCLKIVDKKPKLDIYACTLCKACISKCKKGLEIQPKANSFLFELESENMDEAQVVYYATKTIEARLDELSKKIK